MPTLSSNHLICIFCKQSKIIPEYNTLSKNNDLNAPKVRKIRYQDSVEMCEKINNEIRKLTDQGIEKKDIVLLTPYRLHNDLLSKINGITKYSLDSKGIRYSTIAGFKGLESKVVFLVNIYVKTKKDILFVGYSRAKSLLYVFERK